MYTHPVPKGLPLKPRLYEALQRPVVSIRISATASLSLNSDASRWCIGLSSSCRVETEDYTDRDTGRGAACHDRRQCYARGAAHRASLTAVFQPRRRPQREGLCGRAAANGKNCRHKKTAVGGAVDLCALNWRFDARFAENVYARIISYEFSIAQYARATTRRYLPLFGG